MSENWLRCEVDGLHAYITVDEGLERRFSVQELRTLLNSQGIVYGVDEKALEGMALGLLKGRIRVASGKPMEPGTPGRIEWFVDLSKVGKPRELEDGRVDLRDLQLDLNVRKGDKLAVRIPPKPGKEGINVFGKSIYPPEPEDVCIIAGRGADYAENDRNCIVAAIDGAVVYNGRVVEVHDRKSINGDIDYSTGNVFFNGDLRITGSVRAGFSVTAMGDIYIYGDVEDAEIKSGGSVIIKGGAIGGGSGKIKCDGSIKVHHVSKFELSAGKNIIVEEDILHSTVSAEGSVYAKSVVGGTVSAFSVKTEVTGSIAEARTVVDVTRAFRLGLERYNLLKQFGTLMAERSVLYDKMFNLVRNGMDEKGLLKFNDLQELGLLKKNTLESIKNAVTIQRRLEKIDEMEKEREAGAIVNIRLAYPNTLIKIDNEERLIREKQKNILLKSSLK